MRVVYKPTGQVGDIPDDKFDPNLFQQVESSNVSTKVAETQAPEDNLIMSLVKNMSSPLRFATSGLIQAPVAAATGGKVNTYDTPIIGGLLGLSEKELAEMGGVNAGVGERASRVGQRAAGEALKATATLAPFASAPVGLVAGAKAPVSPLLSKIPVINKLVSGLNTQGNLATVQRLVGGNIGQGVVQGAGEALTDQDAKAGDVLTNALIGGGVGLGANILGNTLGFGKKLREGVLNPQTAKVPWGANEIDRLNDVAFNKLKLTGSADNQYQQLGQKWTETSKQAKQLLDDPVYSQAKFTVKDVTKEFDNLVNETPELLAEVDDKAVFDAVKSKIKRFAGNKKNLELKDLYKLKSKVRDDMRKILGEASGKSYLAAPDAAQHANQALFDTLTDIISKNTDGQVRELNLLQRDMFNIALGLAGNRAGKIKPWNVVDLTVPTQSTQEFLGRTFQSIDNYTKNLQKFAQAPTVAAFVGDEASSTHTDPTNAVSEIQALTRGYNQVPQLKPERTIQPEMILAIQHNPSIPNEVKAYYKDAFDMQEKMIDEGKATANEKTIEMKRESAKRIIDTLESLYYQGNLPSGRGQGLIRTGLAKVTGNDAKLSNYMSARDFSLATIARAGGEVGNLNEQEQARVKDILPTASSTPEEAAMNFATIRAMLGIY